MTEQAERLSMVFHPMQGDESSLSVSEFINGIDGLRKAAGKFNCRDLTIVSLSSNSQVLPICTAWPRMRHMAFRQKNLLQGSEAIGTQATNIFG